MSASFIIIPVFNRRATTVNCLRHLQSLGVFAWATVVIVDDASTDGTVEAVSTAFPACMIVRGDGDLWWGGGINLGMRHALAHGAEDVIWLNDDCLPRAGALEALVKVSRSRHAITVASSILRETGALHYGGMRQTPVGTEVIECAPGEIVPCDTFCGNCVCLPRQVIESLGGIDALHMPHYAGDADYGFRARNAGFQAWVVGDALCDSSYGSGKNRQSWLLGDSSVKELWGICFHPTSGSLAWCGLVYQVRHWGMRGWLHQGMTFSKLILISLCRLTLSRALLQRLAGGSNETQQRIERVRQWEDEQAGTATASPR